MRRLPVILFLSVICETSCSKNEELTDISKPEIKVIYPLDIPKLVPGQPLCLKAVIDDNRRIFLVSWEIYDHALEKQLHLEEFRPEGKNYVLENKYIIPSTWKGDLDVKINATDLCGNSKSVIIPFVVNQ